MSEITITPEMLRDLPLDDDPVEKPVEETRLPSEWAEALDITRLKEEEWQGKEKVWNSSTRQYEGDGVVEWDRQMTHGEFLRALYSDWTYYNDRGVPYRKGKRTYRLPKITITEGMILDVLGDAIGWLPTAEIAWRIFEPMGLFLKNERQPVQKVREVLSMLQGQGLIVSGMDDNGHWDPRYHRIHNEVRGEGSSKMWGRTDKVEQWVADRDLDNAEQERRVKKFKAFLSSLGIEATYTHNRRPTFVDGVIDPDLNTASVGLSWVAMEKIIDIIEHPKAPS